jgi:hypothetical protein
LDNTQFHDVGQAFFKLVMYCCCEVSASARRVAGTIETVVVKQ